MFRLFLRPVSTAATNSFFHGVSQYNKYEFKTALNAFSKFIQENAEKPTSKKQLADAYYYRADINRRHSFTHESDALKDLDACLKLHPNHEKATDLKNAITIERSTASFN
jgi:hypothetical protein